MSLSLADRFEAKVDRFGEHHRLDRVEEDRRLRETQGGRPNASPRGVLLGSWCTARSLKAWK